MSLKKPILSIVATVTVLLSGASGLAPASVVQAVPTATVTINPFQDTYVNEASPTSKYGSSSELWVMADEFNRERRALLQFLLTDIPAGATITSAELQLYLDHSFGVSNVTMTVERNGSGWAAGNVSWNNRPSTHCCWGSQSIGSTTGVYYAWDVTSLVQDWYDGTLQNYGFSIKGPLQSYERQFDSREGSFQPKLVVEYTLGPPPPPPDPQGSIGGRVWHDDDRDGIRDLGEPGLEGVRVDLALDGVVEGTTTTDSNGLYSFTNLEAGVYSVSVDDWTLPGAYQLASGSDPRLVALLADATLDNIHFGYDQADTDLIATGLEVTQAVQDLNNSVRLAANKRTFVRFHVRSSSGVQPTTASLIAEKGGMQVFLLPTNTGMSIDVQPSPSRAVFDHVFLFELPSDFRQGTVSLTATVNPILLPFRATHSPLELTYDNNTASATVSFETVPDLNLIMYRVGYEVRDTGMSYIADRFHVDMAADWLRRAYPVANVWLTVRDLDWGRVGVDDRGRLTDISCGSVHTRVDGLTSANLPILLGGPVYRSFGLVDNGGGFMRGCSMVPARSASGPTGPTGTAGWDTDGSFGDWYTGHELGHSLDQSHIRGGPSAGSGSCGDEAGGRNLYNPFGNYRGTISPVTTGDGALMGYDFGTDDIYLPYAHDVMTYCDFQWMSDITYEGIMDRMQSEASAAAASAPLAATDQLWVAGLIDPDTGDAEIDPLFTFLRVDNAQAPTPGDYAIVLRNGSGAEVARHAFTPAESHPGPPGPGGSSGDEVRLVISEFVPFVSGTDRVDIEGPGGTLLAQVSAGAAVPTVDVTTPAGGSVLAGPTVTVSWVAADGDGDGLTFLVQYSPNDGATWENVSFHTTENSIEISSGNLVAGTKGRFRVLATDGVHTASAVSDLVTVPNHTPEIDLVSPEDGETVMQGQTVNFEALAYDADVGTMPPSMTSWTSNLDGTLGDGTQVSAAELSTGTHTITFEADDGQGGAVSEQVQITVVDDPADLPAPADALVAGPSPVVLAPDAGLTSEVVYVNNEGRDAIGVQVAVDQPWATLSSASGTTPMSLTLDYNEMDLGPGVYTATLTLTSPDAPQGGTTLPVRLAIGPHLQFLPLVLK